MTLELRGYDPGFWGHSLANASELVVPFLDAVAARSVVEVGAYAGDLTRELLEWAKSSGATVAAIDPSPADELVALSEERRELDLVREKSLDALRRIEMPDAVVIDGDHNYYTVSEELRIVYERAPRPGPLTILHDVRWPHARRDIYYTPEDVPEEHRQPVVKGAGLHPDDPSVTPMGIPFKFAAAHEGGPRNGVLTAAEDFVAGSEGARLAIIPVFFGVGIVWHDDAPWADAVDRLARQWDRNQVLERAEANRVHHLVEAHARRVELHARHQEVNELQARVGELYQRASRQEKLLRWMLGSRSIRLAERLSRLRGLGGGVEWRKEIRRALGDP